MGMHGRMKKGNIKKKKKCRTCNKNVEDLIKGKDRKVE